MSQHELNDDEYLHEIECVEESVMAEEFKKPGLTDGMGEGDHDDF